MSKVILGRKPRKTKPNRTVVPPTATVGAARPIVGEYCHGSATTATHPMNLPTGWSVGDKCVWVMVLEGANGIINSVPAGWTQEYNSGQVNQAAIYVYSKTLGSGDSSGQTWTTNGSCEVAAAWIVVPGDVTLSSVASALDPPSVAPPSSGTYDVIAVSLANKGDADPDAATAVSTGFELVTYISCGSGTLQPRILISEDRQELTGSTDPSDIGWADTVGSRTYRAVTILAAAPDQTPAVASGDHTHVEADVTDLDHWTEADHDALDHTGLTGVGVSDHGGLSGLGDDDHTQYLNTARHAAVDAADHGSGAATDGHVLTADGAGGAAWEVVPAGGSTALDDLTDVTITTPSTGEVLKYNGSGWVNDTDATGGGGGQAVPYRVQYLAERVTGETSHTDDLFFATEGSLTGTAVDGAGTGTGTWSLSDGQLKLIVASTGGSGAREPKARAWAITSASAPMTIETHCSINGFSPSSHSPAIMLGFSDGTTTGSNIANVYSYLGLAGLLEAHGTFNGNGFSGFNDTILSSRWDVWQRIVWVSSNTFQVQVAVTSPHTGSLLNWSAGGTGTLSKTMTPTHFWVGAANDSSTATWIAWDYIRVYDSDLSV